jgi:hypothetical protein
MLLAPAVGTASPGALGVVAGADGVAERSPERAPSPTELTSLSLSAAALSFVGPSSVQLLIDLS